MTDNNRGRILGEDFEYSGQWFDDLGAAVMAAGDRPVMGYDIANTPGLTRDELNDVVARLSSSSFDPYGGAQQ